MQALCYCPDKLNLNNNTSGIKKFSYLNFKVLYCYEIIDFIRIEKKCNDDIVIYTGYERDECKEDIEKLKKYPNIIIKWGRFIMN